MTIKKSLGKLTMVFFVLFFLFAETSSIAYGTNLDTKLTQVPEGWQEVGIGSASDGGISNNMSDSTGLQ